MEHLGPSCCVALGDRAGHQVDLVPFITEEDSVTFSDAAEGHRNPGLYARQATGTGDKMGTCLFKLK